MLSSIYNALGGGYGLIATILGIIIIWVLLAFRGPGIFWSILIWLFPPVLLFIAWLFPSLHGSMSFGMGSLISAGGVVLIVLGFIWVAFIQMPMANDPDTLLHQLKADFYVSVLWAGLLLAFSAYLTGSLRAEWWFVLPTIIAWADVIGGTRCALNNAYSKNPTQIPRFGQPS